MAPASQTHLVHVQGTHQLLLHRSLELIARHWPSTVVQAHRTWLVNYIHLHAYVYVFGLNMHALPSQPPMAMCWQLMRFSRAFAIHLYPAYMHHGK